MATQTLTQSRLKEILHYDPDTGVFTWRIDRNHLAKAGTVAGHAQNKGRRHTHYLRTTISSKPYQLHRLAFLYMTGLMPTGVVDHIDGNGLNNKWSNIRDVTVKENLQNRRRDRRNKTGTTGVGITKNGRYRADITIHLGTFDTLEEAVKARKEAEERMGYHPNHGR